MPPVRHLALRLGFEVRLGLRLAPSPGGTGGAATGSPESAVWPPRGAAAAAARTGRALRFAEGPPWAFGAELSPPEIERRTSPSRKIDPPPPPEVTVVGELPVYGGYLIFTAPGR